MFLFKKGKHEIKRKISDRSRNKRHEKPIKVTDTVEEPDKRQNIMFTVEDNPKSIVTEAYKTLRTNIQYSSFDKKIKTVVITSSEISEGKSTVAKNIALTFAQSEKKVILIDCDLRKPSVHENFNFPNLAGLSEILIGTLSLEEVVQKHNENFYFITSGKIPPNPSEMLASAVMAQLIEKLKKEYEIIILDTPPLNVVTDAQVLSVKVDGTILIVRAGITKKDVVIEAKNLLDKVGANIIGTVLYAAQNTRSKYY